MSDDWKENKHGSSKTEGEGDDRVSFFKTKLSDGSEEKFIHIHTPKGDYRFSDSTPKTMTKDEYRDWEKENKETK